MAEASSSVKTSLIPNQERSHELEGATISQQGFRRGDFVEEAKLQLWLAGPLIAVSLMQYSLQVTSVMYVGHLGELALSSASMASSFASVTGFSVLLGMGSALETLCGQAYGAKQYNMLGVHMQRAMLTLLAVSFPLALIWFYTSTILMALGQDHEISTEAGTFNQWMIPSLFAFSLLQCLNRFLQTQNNVFPMMISSGVTAFPHIMVCWALCFKFGLGNKGAALAISISNWVNVLLLASYVNFEYWSFEMVVLLSGLLPNPKLETSVLSISLNTCWMVYMISVGLGSAISTRVSNELGAGRPQGAQLALRVMTIMALSEGAAIATATVLVRYVWGKLYSNENEVIIYVAKMMPLLALSDFLDGFQCVLSGAARGCGWQNLCVLINLGAYYVVGIPTAALFAFILHIGGMGLWMGIICGLLVQVTALVAVNVCTDWYEEATKAANRVQNTVLLIDKAT
ncbi:protein DETOXIFICATION 16 isoform X1 [Prunus yedoensis var. nudiflora]|uniref:Protein DETOXIFICATION n=1 Tax=Prunus yedoensis var. nudiflora TaxID=2094558 RepID=A0A314UC58_PRUYE|nr:protein DETOXIFICATION 16 isoform X1 [Prunus yedoensis var. nudiflora]